MTSQGYFCREDLIIQAEQEAIRSHAEVLQSYDNMIADEEEYFSDLWLWLESILMSEAADDAQDSEISSYCWFPHEYQSK